MLTGVTQGGAPVMVLNQNTKRETGRKAQIANIKAAKAIADVIVSTLGPRSMLKMLLDPMGGVVLSNDGHAILREIDVNHPAAKSMLEISRSQDEEVGDGTTSVIVLAGEMMSAAQPFIERDIHPTIICQAYYTALAEGVAIMKEIAVEINQNDDNEIRKALKSCIGTKFASRWGTLVENLAIESVKKIQSGCDIGKLNLDIKRYARIEKIPGGLLEECKVLDGVMVNKDVVHPNMRRYIKNPRVILLDCTLEYKKGESQTNMEMTKESDMTDALTQEITEVGQLCSAIMKLNPDVVITEKGVSDIAQHFLLKQNISVIRRVRKTDNQRLARVTGATIVNRPEELQESDIGLESGLFEINKIGDEYFMYMVECKKPKACTILLRGASKDVLNEMERNLHDALAVCKNILQEPKLLPGGGAVEMELSKRLNEKAKTVDGLQQLPLRALAYSLEVIPRTLATNCGADVVRVLTELRARHTQADGIFYGIDGNTGKIVDMRVLGIWESLSVKMQVFKSSIEASCMLLRIDDVVSGLTKKQPQKAGVSEQQQPDETFGDARDG